MTARSCATVTTSPATRQTLRPLCRISRQTGKRPSSVSSPISASALCMRGSAEISKSASTRPRSAPPAMRSRSAFPPRTKSSEPTMMLLPAPVSPVSTVSPGPKDSVSRSISAISRIESCRSTYFIIPLKRSATSGADSTSRRMTRIVLSPASVPTTSFQRIVSTISAAACAPPGSVLMTIWLQA